MTLAFLADVPDRRVDDLVDGLARAAARRTSFGAGIAADGRRFRPHVTLARIAWARDITDWARLLDTYRGPGWPADRIALVASYLGEGPRGRPRHETMDEFVLTG